MDTHNTKQEHCVDIMTYLEILKSSPLADEGFQLDTRNLCGAIRSIANDALCNIEAIQRCSTVSEHLVDAINDNILQISTLSKIIENRVDPNDFMTFCNLIYTYNKLKKGKA